MIGYEVNEADVVDDSNSTESPRTYICLCSALSSAILYINIASQPAFSYPGFTHFQSGDTILGSRARKSIHVGGLSTSIQSIRFVLETILRLLTNGFSSDVQSTVIIYLLRRAMTYSFDFHWCKRMVISMFRNYEHGKRKRGLWVTGNKTLRSGQNKAESELLPRILDMKTLGVDRFLDPASLCVLTVARAKLLDRFASIYTAFIRSYAMWPD